MTDPTRWLDDDATPRELRELLASADRLAPIPEPALRRSRQRVLALPALSAAAGAFFWLPQAALGAALGAAVAAVAVAPGFSSSKTPPQSVGTARPTVASTAPPMKSPLPPAPEPAGETTPPDVAPSVESTKNRARHDAGIHEPVSEHGVTREARLLETARELLARDPPRALAALSRHAREFPHGTLETERELMSVDALMRLHRRADAEAHAAALRARAPNNIYERRIEQILDGK